MIAEANEFVAIKQLAQVLVDRFFVASSCSGAASSSEIDKLEQKYFQFLVAALASALAAEERDAWLLLLRGCPNERQYKSNDEDPCRR